MLAGCTNRVLLWWTLACLCVALGAAQEDTDDEGLLSSDGDDGTNTTTTLYIPLPGATCSPSNEVGAGCVRGAQCIAVAPGQFRCQCAAAYFTDAFGGCAEVRTTTTTTTAGPDTTTTTTTSTTTTSTTTTTTTTATDSTTTTTTTTSTTTSTTTTTTSSTTSSTTTTSTESVNITTLAPNGCGVTLALDPATEDCRDNACPVGYLPGLEGSECQVGPTYSDGCCPNGYVPFGDQCYFFARETHSFENARSFCAAHGGRVISLRTSEQLLLLETFAVKGHLTYIGLTYDVNSDQLQWESSAAPPVDQLNLPFSVNNPPLYGASNRTACAAYYYPAGTAAPFIQFTNCDASQLFVCELDKTEQQNSTDAQPNDYDDDDSAFCCSDLWLQFDQSCYFVSRARKPFADAEAHCNQLNANLITINNNYEYTGLLRHAAIGQCESYLGLTVLDDVDPQLAWVGPEQGLSVDDLPFHTAPQAVPTCVSVYNPATVSEPALLYATGCTAPRSYVCEVSRGTVVPPYDDDFRMGGGGDPGSGGQGQRTCPDGWVVYQRACYLFPRQQRSYPAAVQQCRLLDSELITVTDVEELSTIVRQSTERATFTWIGLGAISTPPDDLKRYPDLTWTNAENNNNNRGGGRGVDKEELPWLNPVVPHGFNPFIGCTAYFNPFDAAIAEYTVFQNCNVANFYVCKRLP